MIRVCTVCRSSFRRYHLCDRVAGGVWCENCVAQSPCVVEQHPEGCMTAVFSQSQIKNIHEDGVLHLSLHAEEDGSLLLSLWDTEDQARRGGAYLRLQLTEEQLSLVQETEGLLNSLLSVFPGIV